MPDQSVDQAIAEPTLYADADRYHALFKRLRAEEPVRWTAPSGYRPFWLVSRHADIVQVEREPELFINAPRAILRAQEIEARLSQAQGGNSNLLRSMNNMDGEEHRNYRGVTQREFVRPNIEKLSAQIDAIAAEFVQRMIDKGPELDFVEDVANWYPLRVIMMLLGIEPEHEAKMLRLTQQIFGVNDPEIRAQPDAPKDAPEAFRRFCEFFRPLMEERRRAPRDDFASLIANARVDGKPLGDFETLSYYVTMATAGHDTTSASISGGLLALIQHPQQFAALRAMPDVTYGVADEMIRWVAPVKHFFRTATADCELRGQTIRAGDSLMLAYPSACRDEEVYSDPFVFRLDRGSNPHLAMGTGVHVCLGQHLARLEMRLFFRHLLARIEQIELAGEPAWVEATFISGFKRLPIRFTAKAAA